MTEEFVIDFKRWGGGERKAVGEAIGWMYRGNMYGILYTKAGMYRGNHVHKTDQHTILLNGKGRYVFQVEGKNVDNHLVVGKVLDVPAGIPHILLPEEDCLTIEWWDGAFGAEEFDFPEFMDDIRKRIEKVMKKVED